MTAALVVAIDAGKTGTRLACYRNGDRGPTVTGPGIPNVATDGGLLQIKAVLVRLIEELPVDLKGCAGVCIGMTGVLQPDHHAAAVADVLAELVDAPRLVVTSDVVTNYCGALGAEPGVVVAAGTGSIILGVGEDSTLARVDGWGYLLDDAGSAFDIGRRGLREVLRAGDGRGGSQMLATAAAQTFGDPAAIVERVYGSANPARVIASFAQDVADAAHQGDRIAIGLLADAGEDLALGALAAADRALGTDAPVDLSWQGGVFKAGDFVLDTFKARVAAARPGVVFHPPAGDALDGAAALAQLDGPTVLDGLLAVHETMNS